jgi:hypothetical protein
VSGLERLALGDLFRVVSRLSHERLDSAHDLLHDGGLVSRGSVRRAGVGGVGGGARGVRGLGVGVGVSGRSSRRGGGGVERVSVLACAREDRKEIVSEIPKRGISADGSSRTVVRSRQASRLVRIHLGVGLVGGLKVVDRLDWKRRLAQLLS